MTQPQNQYLPFANSPTANTLQQPAYAALGQLLTQGFVSGVALSVQANTLFRQLSVAVSGLAQFVADNQTQDVLDDGVPANFEAKFKAALLSAVQAEGAVYVADGGTADALIGTPSPALTAYRTGQVIAVQKNASVGANATATPTINLNGLGAVTIVKGTGGSLYANDLPQGGMFMAVYDGQYFRHIGITLSTADLRVQAGQAVAFTASGTNAYTGTLTPAPTALAPRMEVLGAFGTPNTSAAAPTLLLNGIGSALPILKQNGAVPGVGDIAGFVPLILNTAGTAWIVNGLVSSDIGTYVANNLLITTALTKVIGTDFPTLAAAMAWVSQYTITSTGSVNFVLPAGQTTLTGNLLLQHPQGFRITITGAPMIGANPTSASFQVTGASASQRAADKAANLAMCRARYGSEILLSGGVTIYIVGKFGTISNLLITSDGTTTANGGDIVSFPDGQANFIGCVVNGGASRGFIVGGAGSLTTSGTFAFGNGGNGFSAEEGGKIILTNGAGTFGNGGHGCLASGGACLLVDQTVSSSLAARGNGGSGIQSTLGASIPTIGPAAVLSNNGVYGAGASLNGTACADGATAANNGLTGFAASSGGTVSAVNSSGSGNGGYGYTASGVGLVIASGGSATGSSGSLSPAANTVGNANAYIYQ